MDTSTLSQIKEIGIAIASVVLFAFITKYTIDKNKEVFDKLVGMLQTGNENYAKYVEENNHGNTERLEKSTQAISQFTSAVESHTKVVEGLSRVVEKLSDKLDVK